jgi:hypothetical protein
MVVKVKRILNPVTGKCYELRQHEPVTDEEKARVTKRKRQGK